MNSNDLTTRKFSSEDWHDICRIYELATVQEHGNAGIAPTAIRPMGEDEDLDTFSELNSSRVACIHGDIVGFVAWREGGYLSWLYVDPKHQRCGIGSRLLGEAMSHLGGQAWTLTKGGNDPAIALYEKYGMEIVLSYPKEIGGYAHTEHRLALATSRKSDPKVPSFGA